MSHWAARVSRRAVSLRGREHRSVCQPTNTEWIGGPDRRGPTCSKTYRSASWLGALGFDFSRTRFARRPFVTRGVAWSAACALWLLAPGASADLPRPSPKPQPVEAPAPRPKPQPVAAPAPQAKPILVPSASVAPAASADAAAPAEPSSQSPVAEPAPSAESIPEDTPSAHDPQDSPDTAQAANARRAQAARSSFLVGASFVGLLAGFWAMMRWRKSRLRTQLEAMEKRDAGASAEDESP